VPRREEDRASILRKAGPLMNLGLTFALGIALLAWVGNWADGKWGTEPWLTLTGAVLGVVVGFVNLFRVALPPKEDR
jgi:F0F1-type ATP synthase assembly protein I